MSASVPTSDILLSRSKPPLLANNRHGAAARQCSDVPIATKWGAAIDPPSLKLV